MWCSMPISFIAGAAGSSCSAHLQTLPALLSAEPRSRNYVQHLRLWYAQSHPTRTSPRLLRCGCGRARTGAPAISAGRAQKLRYVDELMREIAGNGRFSPIGKRSIRSARSARRSRVLQEQARALSGRSAADYDRDLLRLFSADPKHRHAETAASSSAQPHRVRELVAKWTGEYQLTVDACSTT